MSAITPLHVERGRQVRRVLQADIVRRGLSMDAAVEALASELGMSRDAILLAVAIANGADDGTLERLERGEVV